MHEALLAAHARPVVGLDPAAGVPEGLVAVQMPFSGGNVPANRRSDTPDGGALSDVDRDTADGVYELGETGHEIGRASCRERGEIGEGGGGVRQKAGERQGEAGGEGREGAAR